MRIPMRKAALVCAAGMVGAALLAASAARAASLPCDSDRHCVAADGVGTPAGGACMVTTTGAIQVQTTCSTGSASVSASGGPATVVVVPGPAQRVCWSVIAYFPSLSGGTHSASTSGCRNLP